MNQSECLNQINQIRKRMIEIGLHKGLNSTETISISKQLDQLLFNYQLLMLGKR
ncbi:Spo0E family sporulation regulatory protein-aspartic acid phosphatase [Neobacillus sp. D3-1R]|uniref:Spo0E family sporulation regulatory protein-aspartic acid phosphatase n=1 Tax=Neobacillus sp. D3-1R TaxID=3445778 RepID=UPI003F9F9683